MKMITAILRPSIIDDLREELAAIGVSGITATNVHGFGAQKGHTEQYRGNEYQVDFIPKVKLEIAVSAEFFDTTIATIKKIACSGKIGDGKIFVTTIDKVIRIRTGEEDGDAL
jgi:nitrogen regulatory protein P-II 2